MSEPKRYIPLPIRVQLRKEAYFGCVECGNPILDYHHIIPWSEVRHNEPEHMLAVCPTHHREISKRPRNYAYDKKKNPFNASIGKFRGELVTDKARPSFIMGTNTFISTPNIFTYYTLPIIKYRIENDQSLLSVFIPDQHFWPEIEIVDNDIVANSSIFWDIEFSSNYLRFRKKEGETSLEIDLRGAAALVSGSLSIDGNRFRFSATKTNFGGAVIKNSTFENCGCGIGFGDNKYRLLRPNYAMRRPQRVMQRVKW
ncbi:MAG: hypothetical protein COB16_14725 [Rhodobacteraceae bacterium]|nr:MAG: hypothetical protein COB16_14725 [Paracoccaceae bacterium]